MAGAAERWIKFLRKYGPIPRNDNMFDEHIRKSATYLKTRPIFFEHPLEDELLEVFCTGMSPKNVVLTGTAGDGKSHLCGQIWQALGGSADEWSTDDVYFQVHHSAGDRQIVVHVIRDLTALPDQDRNERYASKESLLNRLSDILFDTVAGETFVLAANDGQLIETWAKVASGPAAERAAKVFEARLMEDRDQDEGASLEFFNLSRVPSATIFEKSLNALLQHDGWEACNEEAELDGFFGDECPIRKNYELLRTPLVQSRLRHLFRLCDLNELHTPIRRVLMLLANALLGHPDVRDRLLLPKDIRGLLNDGMRHKASLYSNLFGANLTKTKRESLEIFDYLGRFGIGHETTNRIDNILIFGAQDDTLKEHFDRLVASDTFYGNTESFRAAQQQYLETPEATTNDSDGLVEMLTEQRRGLFFKIPDDEADELRLWDLSVFAGAGEYLKEVAERLSTGRSVPHRITARLVKGLNRIFTGRLVETERELLLATSLSLSSARVSQLIEDRIAVQSRGGRAERVDISLQYELPSLDVHLPDRKVCSLRLNLTRYEFLMRVGAGALPGNFSRECYEDILAFKSRLLSAVDRAAVESGADPQPDLTFNLFDLDASGNPVEDTVVVRHD